jgi:hypothetical protein
MSSIEPTDPLGLTAALATIPEAAALNHAAFLALHEQALATLTSRLATRLTSHLDENQLAEYAAAAHYQNTHPGTGEHTRAWVTANLPDHHALLAEETRRILTETTHMLTRTGNP